MTGAARTAAPADGSATAESAIKQRLRSGGVVAVLRASSAVHFTTVARVLVEAGVTALEVTLTTPDAVNAIAAIKAEAPDHVLVGAGTVLDELQAAQCIQHDADFLVAPALVPDVIRLGLSASVPVYPGALTPTEFVAASRLGVDLVKLFPANTVGPKYLEDLRGPLPHLDVMPTGGIGLAEVSTWLSSGALAVGLGGPLLGDAVEGGSLRGLRGRAEEAMAAVHAANGQE